jgi:hypothetical protein
MLCDVCTVSKEMRSAGFSVAPQNQGLRFVSGLPSKPPGRFLPVCLKTGSIGLVIWATKSLCRFLGLCPKTKRVMVYRLCHKTDGRMKTTQDQDGRRRWREPGPVASGPGCRDGARRSGWPALLWRVRNGSGTVGNQSRHGAWWLSR